MTDPNRGTDERNPSEPDAQRELQREADREANRNPTSAARAEASTTEAQRDAVKAAGPPAGAAAGAIAGATAGLASGAFGPIGAMVGAIVGALGGTAVGTVAGQAAAGDLYTAEDDIRYRTLWESRPDRVADQGFDSVRLAYQYGHIAAHQPEFAGAAFADVEPELHRRWPNELRARAGEWEAVREYVEDAFGYARSRGAGQRRDATIVGTAGSAVDPVERDRARAGLPSIPEPPH